MIERSQLDGVVGATAVGTDGELGPVVEVFVDDGTGAPEWVAVRTAHVGELAALVPLVDAALRDGELRVPYDGATVRSAPHHDIRVEGDLSAVDEAELLRHYGLDAGRAIAEAVGTVEGPGPAEDRRVLRRHRPTGS